MMTPESGRAPAAPPAGTLRSIVARALASRAETTRRRRFMRWSSWPRPAERARHGVGGHRAARVDHDRVRIRGVNGTIGGRGVTLIVLIPGGVWWAVLDSNQ